MKKKILLGLLVLLAIIPLTVKAATEEYVTMNLEEALTQEKIEHNLSGYTESEDQAIVYLFRGNGCSYCRSFLTFLNSIVPEYGKYFKVVSYETWYDANNQKLLDEVSEFMGEPASGVPYIIIGDKVFGGYATTYDNEIKTAIMNLYEAEEKYDVFEEMAKAPSKSASTSTMAVVVWNAVIVVVATTVVIIFMVVKNNRLNERLDSLEKQLKGTKAKKLK